MTVKRLVVTIEGVDGDDLVQTLDEVRRLVRETYTSGHNRNDTGAFNFDITDEDEPKLAWEPRPEHRPPNEQAAWSISDDDLCATCTQCVYRPGELSNCRKGWPAKFDKNGYVISCGSYEGSYEQTEPG